MKPLDVQSDFFLNLLEGVAFVIDRDNTWSHLSPAWEHLTGLPVADTLGTPACDALHPAEKTKNLEVLNALLTGARHKAIHETRYLTHQGETRYAELIMQTNQQTDQSEQHTPVIVGILRDITERKRAESALLRSEQQSQRIVDHTPCMIACLQSNLHITFVNTAFASNHGRRVDEVIGMSILELLHPSQHNQARNHLASLSKLSPQNVVEHWVTRYDGAMRYQRWTDHVFFDDGGRISGYQTVGVDLTEHKHTQDALRESESQFRSLVESSTDIIFMLDATGAFSYLSPSWQEVLGRNPEDALGQSFVPLLHPEDVEQAMNTFVSLLAGQKITDSVIYRVQHRDGAWHWHAARGAPLLAADGTVAGAVGIARDITNKQHDEQALKGSLQRLEQALTDNTLLIKEMHHRVKNNLQIVASLLSLQSRQLTDIPAKEALAASRNRVMAMAEIHTMMYQHEQVDAVIFDAYLYALIDRIKHAYGILGITFTLDGDSFELSVNQAIPLGLIVNELLINAVKYAFEPTNRQPHVTIRLINDTHTITVTVEDNGTGVPATFDPAQSNSLGMTIVQSLTSQLNGTVSFVNRVNTQGLQVTVSIPHANTPSTRARQ